MLKQSNDESGNGGLEMHSSSWTRHEIMLLFAGFSQFLHDAHANQSHMVCQKCLRQLDTKRI